MDAKIEKLKCFMDSSIDGVTYVPKELLQEIVDYILELKRENREIRETHYHESVLELYRKKRG